MAYKETQFLRVTFGLFGILSHGMALAVGALHAGDESQP